MRSEPHLVNGRYKLVLRLGQGGQASVWLGEDTLIKRRVALKQLVPGNGAGDDSVTRMRAIAEARAMARVRHPVIVPIHDILFAERDSRTGDYVEADAATGEPWLVMEFIEGRTLGGLMDDQAEGRPLGDAAIARIGLAVLDGLDAVHRAEIVHRDVKPDNILVVGNPADAGCRVFLVDFGIAKIDGAMSVTHPNQVVGTPLFIAPERLTHEAPGPAADLYSLGVTLFCAVDGAPPFRTPDGEYRADAIRHAVIHDQPRSLRRSSELASIIYRLMVKDPAQRAKSGEARRELSAALHRITAQECPQRTTGTGRPGTKRPGGPVTGQPSGGTIPLLTVPPPGPSDPPPPGPKYRPRMRVGDVRDLILKVGTDTGVGMLLSIPGQDAAAILDSCPQRLGADLLTGIASAQPSAASAIMDMLTTDIAARMLAHMKGEALAVVLRGLETPAAVRILDAAGDHTAALALKQVKQVSDTHAARLLKAMSSHRAAAIIVRIKPEAAADILRTDAGLKTSVLSLVPAQDRRFITRYLEPGT